MTILAKEEHALREEMVRIAASFFQRGYATGSAGTSMAPEATAAASQRR